jgi:hypothetical protein
LSLPGKEQCTQSGSGSILGGALARTGVFNGALGVACGERNHAEVGVGVCSDKGVVGRACCGDRLGVTGCRVIGREACIESEPTDEDCRLAQDRAQALSGVRAVCAMGEHGSDLANVHAGEPVETVTARLLIQGTEVVDGLLHLSYVRLGNFARCDEITGGKCGRCSGDTHEVSSLHVVVLLARRIR